MPKRKVTRYKTVTQKDIKTVKTLADTNQFSISGIADVIGRSWGTVNQIVKSNFNLSKYRKLQRLYRLAHSKGKTLTFKPFKDNKIKGPVKVQKTIVTPEKVVNSLSNMDDVLNEMWEVQQADAKAISSKNEAIHKIRNGLQKISEGLGELL